MPLLRTRGLGGLFYVLFVVLYLTTVLDAKRITNVSTKTTSQPLMQSIPHAPANLQNRYLFDHGPLSYQTLYRTDVLSCVRATVKHLVTNQYRYRTDVSRYRNRAELIVIVIAELILQPFPSLYLRHISFSNPSVALPTSQLILQLFRCFT